MSKLDRTPPPAYQAADSSPLKLDEELYSNIAATPARELTESFILPIRSGRAWVVPQAHLCRLTTPEGPQVGDLNIWNLRNPRERFWAARTRQLHRSHVTTFDRLWSCLPYMRPLVTITADSLSDYGVDEHGGRVHDVSDDRCLHQPDESLLGTRCDPYVNEILSGESFDFQCHSNLTRAVLPYGLTEFDIHDVLNVFQVTGLNKNGQYFMEPSPAKVGDYFEFFAEIDILCALSTCPGGDLSNWGWGKSENNLGCCRPLGVEVYQIKDSAVLDGWKPPIPASYAGLHGMKLPESQEGA